MSATIAAMRHRTSCEERGAGAFVSAVCSSYARIVTKTLELGREPLGGLAPHRSTSVFHAAIDFGLDV
jgi:hypothetical protein